ncbi:SRPBCC domain-containing protein [Pseudactinotalea suaedae]|uniref:SRPBCC domain-containing protein n=1 Tax=Pseudactinotalea suaedae TaxID=1524924 RepID=UPI0013916A6E|nr:SRPBCC domain-containing protein [Pseudactinotalea suaedae]
MTAAEIDVDTSTVHRTIRIDAPRPLVWATLTSPEQIAQWFGDRAEFPDGVHAGAQGLFGWSGHGDHPARIEIYEPHARFAFTWGRPGEPIREDNSTTAVFTLDEEGEATVLTVVESGFDTLTTDDLKRRAALEDNAQGWTSELDELTAYVTSLREGRSAVADLETGTITRTVLVAADQGATWTALTTLAAIEAWWGHPATFADGVRPGSLGTFEWAGHGLFPVVIDVVEEPGRFALTWGELGETTPGATATHVTFALTAVGEQTLLTVVETGFENRVAAARREAMEGNVDGWNAVLDSFTRFAEARR